MPIYISLFLFMVSLNVRRLPKFQHQHQLQQGLEKKDHFVFCKLPIFMCKLHKKVLIGTIGTYF